MSIALVFLPVIAAAVLWVLGLRVFLRSQLSTRHKIVWTAVLIFVGLAIGALLPASSIWRKFILVLIVLPLVAAIDLALLKPRRTASFWLRACGYEVCTVFGVAAVARALLNWLGVSPLLTS